MLLAKCQLNKLVVKSETTEQRERRLLAKRQQNKLTVESETTEQRERRLLAKRQQNKLTVESETTEQRKTRSLNKQKQKKQAIHSESDEQRENRLTQNRQNAKKAYHNMLKWHAQSQENCNTKRLKNKTLTQLIADFHNAVSSGPVYICTCCDQLWYKHSVSLAHKIRASNPNAVKLLQNITSVNYAEWLCQTCMKHLKSRKVPPVAVVKGMKFSQKPAFFFTLMNLSAGLLHPD